MSLRVGTDEMYPLDTPINVSLHFCFRFNQNICRKLLDQINDNKWHFPGIKLKYSI